MKIGLILGAIVIILSGILYANSDAYINSRLKSLETIATYDIPQNEDNKIIFNFRYKDGKLKLSAKMYPVPEENLTYIYDKEIIEVELLDNEGFLVRKIDIGYNDIVSCPNGVKKEKCANIYVDMSKKQVKKIEKINSNIKTGLFMDIKDIFKF